MVLAIDIGNSDIVLGGYENDTLRFHQPLRHRPAQDSG